MHTEKTIDTPESNLESKSTGELFTLPGSAAELWSATLQMLQLEQISILEQNESEGIILTKERRVPATEMRAWTKSVLPRTEGVVVLEIVVTPKNERASTLRIRPAFELRRNTLILDSEKELKSSSVLENMLAGRTHSLLLDKKYPTLIQLAIGSNFQFDEKIRRYRTTGIEKVSWGAEQGFHEGDVILDLDGRRMEIENFFEELASIHETQTKRFTVERDEKIVSLPVRIYFLSADLPWVGMKVERERKSEKFQVVQVAPRSPAQKAGLKAGDTLVSEEGVQYSSWANYYDLVVSTTAGEGRYLTIERDGKTHNLKITPQAVN